MSVVGDLMTPYTVWNSMGEDLISFCRYKIYTSD